MPAWDCAISALTKSYSHELQYNVYTFCTISSWHDVNCDLAVFVHVCWYICYARMIWEADPWINRRGANTSWKKKKSVAPGHPQTVRCLPCPCKNKGGMCQRRPLNPPSYTHSLELGSWACFDIMSSRMHVDIRHHCQLEIIQTVECITIRVIERIFVIEFQKECVVDHYFANYQEELGYKE